jgi:tetratricopeptide (TPR) repeat protein
MVRLAKEKKLCRLLKFACPGIVCLLIIGAIPAQAESAKRKSARGNNANRGVSNIQSPKKSLKKPTKSVTAKEADSKSGSKSVEGMRPAVSAAPAAGVTVPAVVKVEDLNALPAKDLYIKAREYFANGNYGMAIRLASLAKSKTPTATLPVILMAQSYYRMGNNPKAEALFRSVEIGDILPEAAVDYALSMFSARRYREVIKIYPLVSEGNPYKDIVKFYVGVAYVNFEQYNHAIKYLRKAGNLPPNLKAQRRRILSEIDDLRDRERSRSTVRTQQPSQLNWSQSYVMPPPPPSGEVLPGGTPGAATAAKPSPAPPPPLAKSSNSFSATPLVKLAADTSKKDFSGISQEQSESKTTSSELALGAKFLGRARSFGSQPSLDLNVTPSYQHTESKTTTSKLTASVDDPTNVQNNIEEKPKSSFALTYIYGLNGLYPVSEPVDIGAGYNVASSHSDLRIDSTTSTPSIKAVVEIGDFKVDGNWSQAQYTEKQTPAKENALTSLKVGLKLSGDNQTTTGAVESQENSKPLISGVKSRLILSGSWLTNFDDISLQIAASKTDVTRVPLFKLGQPLKQWTASATGTYMLPLAISLDLLGGYTSSSNMVTQLPAVDGVVPEALGTMTGKQFKITLKGKFSSFLSISSSYSYVSQSPAIDNPAFEKEIIKNNFSQNTSTSVSLGISESF